MFPRQLGIYKSCEYPVGISKAGVPWNQQEGKEDEGGKREAQGLGSFVPHIQCKICADLALIS